MVGAGSDQASRQDQSQSGMHPRLLQLRGRVSASPGRQLQRRLLPVLQSPQRGERADGGAFQFHKEVAIAPILTSPCPRRGRREPKTSDGRGATLATADAQVVLLSDRRR